MEETTAQVAPTPAQTAPATPASPSGGKKFPVFLTVLIGIGVLCVLGAVGAYFLVFSGMGKKFETAKENIAEVYDEYSDEALDTSDEEESMDLYISMVSDMQKETTLVMCFAIKDKDDKQDCEDLKEALADAKEIAKKLKAIYVAEEEDEKSEELMELISDFTSANMKIFSICGLSWY